MTILTGLFQNSPKLIVHLYHLTFLRNIMNRYQIAGIFIYFQYTRFVEAYNFIKGQFIIKFRRRVTIRFIQFTNSRIIAFYNILWHQLIQLSSDKLILRIHEFAFISGKYFDVVAFSIHHTNNIINTINEGNHFLRLLLQGHLISSLRSDVDDSTIGIDCTIVFEIMTRH